MNKKMSLVLAALLLQSSLIVSMEVPSRTLYDHFYGFLSSKGLPQESSILKYPAKYPEYKVKKARKRRAERQHITNHGNLYTKDNLLQSIDLYLSIGADINYKYPTGPHQYTVLACAIQGKAHPDVIKKLLENGANADARFGRQDRMDSLTLACRLVPANLQIVELVLQYMKKPISHGALDQARYKRDFPVLKALLTYQRKYDEKHPRAIAQNSAQNNPQNNPQDENDELPNLI